MTINRGSEWRKWDLHVHTPFSIYQRFGNNDEITWEKYIKDLENLPKEFAVIGINDYLFIDGYAKLRNEQIQNSRLSNLKLLPVVEFRIEKFAGIDFAQLKRINLHVIFSDEVPIETIQSQFLNTLEQSYYLETGDPWTRAITQQSVEELGKQIKSTIPETELHKYGSDLTEGFNNLNVKEEDIFKSLKKDCFKGKHLIAIGKTEWGDLKWTEASIATKKSVINKADIVFTASQSIVDFNKAKTQLTKQGVNDLLLDCSDAHYLSTETDKDRIGNCNTWIKAEPTFEGLKQVLNEPENRVYIGDFPIILKRIRQKPSKFIDKIEIDHTDGYDEKDGTWFKSQVTHINPELTVIIGNKGKGKSAITDIIGLCGNSYRQKDFSFLSNIKFKKKGLAKNFEAKLFWMDGNIIKKNLNDSIDENSIEKVKYIPQNFFEELCNNIDDDRAFRKEINDVVFRHIDETQRLNKSSFDEFINEKQITIYNDIKLIKDNITEVNKQIIDKQNKTAKNNIEILKSQLEQKEIELENINNNEPKKNFDETQIINLEENSNLKQANKLNKEIDLFKTQEKIDLEKLTDINSNILRLQQLKERISSQEVSINKFIETEKLLLNEFKIDYQKVFVNKPQFKLEEVDNKISLLYKEKIIIELNHGKIKYDEKSHSSLGLNYENLIINKTKVLSEKLEILLSSLEGNMKAYQEYEKENKDWKEKKLSIIGDEKGNVLGTINYFKKEIIKCENEYPQEIIKLKKERLLLSLNIYDKKKEIINIYLSLKNNIEKILEDNNDKIKEYNINIDATFEMNSFKSNFLDYINKNIGGSFYGNNESEKVISDLISSMDINDKESYQEFLMNIQSEFENNRDKMQSPFTQLKQNKEPLDFYNYIFGLEYLKEKYELKLDGKSIEQLSPGERGAALIVFYLLLDNNDMPLIIDQPEDNLDSHSVYKILVPFIKDAKKRRQIIIVTHNPNLAVVSDAELVIHVNINKENKNKFSHKSGAIENEVINKSIVNILEGTEPAFRKRKDKYGF